MFKSNFCGNWGDENIKNVKSLVVWDQICRSKKSRVNQVYLQKDNEGLVLKGQETIISTIMTKLDQKNISDVASFWTKS